MKSLSVVLALGFVSVMAPASAQWANETVQGTAVSTETQFQLASVSCPDDAGGVIIAWADYRNGTTNRDIYAQRLNRDGQPVWTVNGDPVCTATGNQMHPTITAGTLTGNRSWQVDGLGLAGITYSIVLDTTGMTGISNLDQVVILKRPNDTSQVWTPLNTTRAGNLLTASGLTSFSQFAIGAFASGVRDWSVY